MGWDKDTTFCHNTNSQALEQALPTERFTVYTCYDQEEALPLFGKGQIGSAECLLAQEYQHGGGGGRGVKGGEGRDHNSPLKSPSGPTMDSWPFWYLAKSSTHT